MPEDWVWVWLPLLHSPRWIQFSPVLLREVFLHACCRLCSSVAWLRRGGGGAACLGQHPALGRPASIGRTHVETMRPGCGLSLPAVPGGAEAWQAFHAEQDPPGLGGRAPALCANGPLPWRAAAHWSRPSWARRASRPRLGIRRRFYVVTRRCRADLTPWTRLSGAEPRVSLGLPLLVQWWKRSVPAFVLESLSQARPQPGHLRGCGRGGVAGWRSSCREVGEEEEEEGRGGLSRRSSSAGRGGASSRHRPAGVGCSSRPPRGRAPLRA